MTVSARTSHALHQSLGDEAANEVIDWMNQMELARAEHRQLMDLSFARFEDRIALRISESHQQMHAELSEFRQEVRGDISRLDVKIEKRYADLMRWSLVYWLGAVGAIAALARIIR